MEKMPVTTAQPQPEEKISLRLSQDTLHINGIKTANAISSVENYNGNVIYSLSDTNCMTINENNYIDDILLNINLLLLKNIASSK